MRDFDDVKETRGREHNMRISMLPTVITRLSYVQECPPRTLGFGKMSQQKEGGKIEKEVSLRESSINYDSRKKDFTMVKEQNKRDISGAKSKSEKLTSGRGSTFDQCFSGSAFPTQYEDECPVNYSLKYSETESYKTVTKTEACEGKFKHFTDYGETDSEQPTNFSLKYAENNCCDEDSKGSILLYYPESKRKFKRFADYAETDLDQPTDFTLKYRETVEEDQVKNGPFSFYENHRGDYCSSLSEPAAEPYPAPDETPLMFSRCSSLNSLSSFVHITQSTPDDRSSVVSDFSRVTSGIISPSELPDSPTQTAPSSPKKIKAPHCFSAKQSEFSLKKSVFEDDVATYKQEDTPMEFSRATSLSSLNLENSVKSEGIFSNPKENSASPQTCVKEKNREVAENVCSHSIKEHGLSLKVEVCKEKLQLNTIQKVEQTLQVDRINSRIQNHGSGSSLPLRKKLNNIGVRREKATDLRPKLTGETEKVYSSLDASDDAVHTYCTEGTPANISHAGSQSDLSSLIPGNDRALPDHFCPEGDRNRSSIASKLSKSVTLAAENSIEIVVKKMMGSAIEKEELNATGRKTGYSDSQSRFEYLREELDSSAKDDAPGFVDENSLCDYSMQSPFEDLVVDVPDSSMCLDRSEACDEPPSHILTPLHNVSPQSPNSIGGGDAEDLEKNLEPAKIFGTESNYWMEDEVRNTSTERDRAGGDTEMSQVSQYEKAKWSASSDAPRFDFYFSEPLTPFEEALLEQCIRLGMPPTKGGQNSQAIKSVRGGKSSQEERGVRSSKRLPAGIPRDEIVSNAESFSPSLEENFDFESSEPLTLFEEALLEQCIRLGMSQRNKTDVEGGRECTGRVTPLEAVLLEQCIRLGMPRKRTSKKPEEDVFSSDPCGEQEKIIFSMGTQLNKLRIVGESEKEKEAVTKTLHFGCHCGKRHNRRKNGGCKKTKKCKS